MSKIDLAKGPYTVTSTIPEGESHTLNKDCPSGFWDDNNKGSDNSATAKKKKPEKVSDIPYEEYMRVIHENNILKQIIIELNVLLFTEK